MEIAIPVTALAKGLYTAAKTAENTFLMHKIQKFEENPLSEKSQKFLDELDEKDGNKLVEIQEQIIHTLTQSESILKAICLKNLLNALCQGKVDWSTFFRMNYTLNQIFTYDLRVLVMYYTNEEETDVEQFTQNNLNHFAQLGLVDYNNTLDANGISLKDMFPKNKFGKSFVENVLTHLYELSEKRATEQFDAQWGTFMK